MDEGLAGRDGSGVDVVVDIWVAIVRCVGAAGEGEVVNGGKGRRLGENGG